MRHGKPLLALALLAVFLAAPLAWSQDAIMMINSESLGKHERPLVRFTHEKHSKVIKCITCHHDFDEYYNNTGPQEVKCSECHMADPKSGDNQVPLQMAMHAKCKACHQGMMAKGNITGPTTCGQCHVWQDQAKDASTEKKPGGAEKKQ